MSRRVALIALLFGCLCLSAPTAALTASAAPAAAPAPASRIEVRLPGGHKRDVPLAEAAGWPVTVTVADPVYQATKTFEGYPLAPLLRRAGWRPGHGDALVFHCADGYAPAMPLARLGEGRAILAVREVGAPGLWRPFTHEHAGLLPGPIYVVWQPQGAGAALSDSLPWPFQVVALEVVSFEERYPRLYPTGAKPGGLVMAGFDAYRNACMACHTVNGQGGAIGPELNVPMSVTEYWHEPYLKQFMRDPASVREGAKMPALPQLTGPQATAIVAYLKHMAAHKRPGAAPAKP
jgi:mono/diheme cytochrome c family protein